MTFMLCLFLLCKMMYKKYFTKDVSRMMPTRMDSKKIFPYSCCEVNIFQTSWLLKAARTWPSGTTWKETASAKESRERSLLLGHHI